MCQESEAQGQEERRPHGAKDAWRPTLRHRTLEEVYPETAPPDHVPSSSSEDGSSSTMPSDSHPCAESSAGSAQRLKRRRRPGVKKRRRDPQPQGEEAPGPVARTSEAKAHPWTKQRDASGSTTASTAGAPLADEASSEMETDLAEMEKEVPAAPSPSKASSDASPRLGDAEAPREGPAAVSSCAHCAGTGTHVFSRCAWCGGTGQQKPPQLGKGLAAVLRAHDELAGCCTSTELGCDAGLRAPELTRFETPETFPESPGAANVDRMVLNEQKPNLQGVLLETLIPSNMQETYYFPGSLPQYDFSAFSPSEPGQWYGWGFVPPNVSNCPSPSLLSPKRQYLEDLGGTGRRPWRWH